jgi:CRP-like cAMP-binding protein
VDRAEVNFFCSLLQVKTLRRKATLLREGEVSRYQTYVVSGCLRTYSIDEAGREHIVMFAPEDWWAGDLYSFLAEKPANYNVDALESTTVVQISKTDIDTLYTRVPKFERFFRMLFQNAFVIHQNRVAGNLSRKAEERYKQFTLTYPGLEQRIAGKYIASYLGVTPEFYSGMRKSNP